MRRRQFSTTTFSELFVLLAIVFLVQTVVHFTLSSEVAVEVPKQRWLFVNQYPSGENAADHIRYVAVGSEVLILRPGHLACHAFAFSDPAPLRALRTGGCERVKSKFNRYPVNDDASGEAYKKLFIKEVKEKYGVTFSISQAVGAQNKYSFMIEPGVDRTNFEIRVGVCLCGLSLDERNLTIPAAWGLKVSRLERPHPIVFEFVNVGTTVRRRQEIASSHIADFEPNAAGMFAPIKGKRTSYSMAGDQCDPVVAQQSKLRETFIYEYVVTADDFEKV